MAVLPEDIALWAILVAPGFLAVVIALNLASIETETSDLQLLIWSLVSSIVVDTSFLAIVQANSSSPVTAEGQVFAIFFTPSFRADYVALLLVLAVLLGGIYSIILINDLPRRARSILQFNRAITSHPGQPWVSFLREAGSVRIKTSDNHLYAGLLNRWSKDGNPNELVISHPHRYNRDVGEYEPVGGRAMLFLGDDIDRILLRETRAEIEALRDDDD